MNFRLSPVNRLLSTAMVLTLAACGGGGGDGGASSPDTGPVIDPGTTPAPTLVTLSGNVFGNQAVRNAVVCMDLNANNACDADEPASARTSAEGAYSIAYDSSKVTAAQVAAASLIAPMVPGVANAAGTTVDAANPAAGNATSAYVLKQVPGKAGQINPLTTLVTAGVTGGMTEAVARSNVTVQLAIPEAKIDNYQNDPAIDAAQIRDNARTMAQVVSLALQDGAPLQVLDQSAQLNAAPGELFSLTYTDSGNYAYRTLDLLDKPAGTVGGANVRDSRGGAGLGTPLLRQYQYPQAYLTPAGWLRCDNNVLLKTTRGNPGRSTFCNSLEGVSYRISTQDISGRTMVSVLTEMAADPVTNTVTGLGAFSGSLGAATFPSGSMTTLRRGFNLNQPIFINNLNTDGRPQATEGTLEQMMAARQASAVTLPGVGGTISLGLGSGNFRNLRVAFTGVTTPTTGTVRFYECDLDATQAIASNCAATQTGSYTISPVNGTRVMRFSGYPETVASHNRIYVEVKNAPDVAPGDWVFMAREIKPTVGANATASRRLNSTAWAAMKQQLGL